MTTHELKCWPEQFQAINSGLKRFEFRKDDRGYEVGDKLTLREWDPEIEDYTHHQDLEVTVTYIIRGPEFGVPEGYVLMSISSHPDIDIMRCSLKGMKWPSKASM